LTIWVVFFKVRCLFLGEGARICRNGDFRHVAWFA